MNVFELKNPDEYKCQVYKYTAGKSVLTIRLFPPKPTDEREYLTFAGVDYMECPIGWIGANFSIAPDEDAIQILKDLPSQRFAPETTAESIRKVKGSKLYTMKTAKWTIKILASYSVKHSFDWAVTFP